MLYDLYVLFNHIKNEIIVKWLSWHDFPMHLAKQKYLGMCAGLPPGVEYIWCWGGGGLLSRFQPDTKHN